jgi:protein ImuB
VERIACVVVPALPLQLVLQDQPRWRDQPVVVVRDDRPQAPVLWANAIARHARVLPGMTFAAARSLVSELRAAAVTPERIDEVNGKLFVALAGYSPRVEPVIADPGAFWLDPNGIVPLYGSLASWASTLATDLQARGWSCTIAVGFHRFRSHAIARSRSGVLVMPDPKSESRLAQHVPLVQLGLGPDLRDQLLVLGIHTLGDLLRLPVAELRARFGEEAARLHAAASDAWVAIDARPLVDPVVDELQLEPPDDDHTRLLFGLRGILHRNLARLHARGQALQALHLRLELDHAPTVDVRIAPAQPTLDEGLLVDLVRLRLESLRLPAAIATARIELEGVRVSAAQLALFQTRARRDLVAGGRALARVRAAFGDASVTRPVLREAHLPEARFGWEPIDRVRLPGVVTTSDEPPPLQRRLLARPVPLPHPPRHEPEAWLGHKGAVARMHGPFRTSGGWWVRTVERDYYWAETQKGELLWVYYDRPRRRWYLQATVE